MATATSNTQITQYYKSGTNLFLSFFTKEPKLVSLALILNIFTTILRLLPAILIGISLEILIDEGYGASFKQTALLIPLSALLAFGTTFVGNYIFLIASFRWERDLRQQYFDVIQSHSLTFHNENNSSKLLSIGINELQYIRHGIMPGMNMVIGASLSILLVVGYLYTLIDIIYVYICVIGFILYFLYAIKYANRVGPVRFEIAEGVGELTEQSQEIFRGIDVVRGMASQKREINKFSNTSTDYALLSRKEARMQAFYIPGLILLMITATIFGLTLQDVNAGTLSVGAMIQVVGLLVSLQFINFMMPFALINLKGSIVNSNRLVDKLNYHDTMIQTIHQSKVSPNWEASLEFRDVSFYYLSEDKLALDSINLAIKPKSKVALIGGPGSGKTTFLKLLLQLYRPQTGSILVDGEEFEKITPYDVRKHISMVEQEVFLFSGTIRDNIAFTKIDATDEEILEVAKAAQAYEFISKMSDGLDTLIGERGVTLSGGQKQRLALARAILANPQILLLDDSSSALDSRTEMLIRKALDNLSKDRLTITVTQRLSTLIDADKIILLERGKLIGFGTHKELLSTNEKYQTIFELLPENERERSFNSIKEEEEQ